MSSPNIALAMRRRAGSIGRCGGEFVMGLIRLSGTANRQHCEAAILRRSFPVRNQARTREPDAMHDPRVFFAAERTLLAWVRTGLTIMAFGFVVARFGLFLRLLAVQLPTASNLAAHRGLSDGVGIALVLVGTGCMVLGAWQHRSYVSTLPAAEIPRSHDPRYPIGLAILLTALGLVLAGYLAI
jgi:putative membrane protein